MLICLIGNKTLIAQMRAPKSTKCPLMHLCQCYKKGREVTRTHFSSTLHDAEWEKKYRMISWLLLLHVLNDEGRKEGLFGSSRCCSAAAFRETSFLPHKMDVFFFGKELFPFTQWGDSPLPFFSQVRLMHHEEWS